MTRKLLFAAALIVPTIYVGSRAVANGGVVRPMGAYSCCTANLGSDCSVVSSSSACPPGVSCGNLHSCCQLACNDPRE